MHVILKLSKLCNLRCTYCYEYDDLGDSTRMPLEGVEHLFAGIGEWFAGTGDTVHVVLHGGEPLLLPGEYLRDVVRRINVATESHGVKASFALQTNLTRIDRSTVEVLEDSAIALGVSLDVVGEVRRNAAGRDSQEKVLGNLQWLLDTGAADRLGVGGISVLHAQNVDRAVEVYRFYSTLGLSYRILPIFALGEVPPRMRGLTLRPAQVLEAYKAVAKQRFADHASIAVLPLTDYLDSAVRHLMGTHVEPYDPRFTEWALIVDTDGRVYNHGDAYSPEGLLGNAFTSPFADIMKGPERRAVTERRLERLQTCTRCSYGSACSRLPIAEALPSERFTGGDGQLTCAIAQPMIDFMLDQIRQSPAARQLLEAPMLATGPST